MTEARAVVDVVGADARPEQPLENVILLVGALGRAEDRERIRPVAVAQARELLGNDLHRLVPRCFAKGLVPVGRSGHAIARISEWAVERRQPTQRIDFRTRLLSVRLALDITPGSAT